MFIKDNIDIKNIRQSVTLGSSTVLNNVNTQVPRDFSLKYETSLSRVCLKKITRSFYSTKPLCTLGSFPNLE